jgi:hypothetical protein
LNENALNQLGYQLLSAGKIGDAIQVSKLNVEEYPKSSNPYDTLGEAYMKAVKTDLQSRTTPICRAGPQEPERHRHAEEAEGAEVGEERRVCTITGRGTIYEEQRLPHPCRAATGWDHRTRWNPRKQPKSRRQPKNPPRAKRRKDSSGCPILI